MICEAAWGAFTAASMNSAAAHELSSLSASSSSCQATGALSANISSPIMVAPLTRSAKGVWYAPRTFDNYFSINLCFLTTYSYRNTTANIFKRIIVLSESFLKFAGTDPIFLIKILLNHEHEYYSIELLN